MSQTGSSLFLSQDAGRPTHWNCTQSEESLRHTRCFGRQLFTQTQSASTFGNNHLHLLGGTPGGVQVNPPVFPGAAPAPAGVAVVTLAIHKLVVFEAHAASHAAAGVGAAVGGAHRQEVVSTVTGKTWGGAQRK